MYNSNHGPIGTKLGTFIIDSSLAVQNVRVSIQRYNQLLVDSINFGLKWISQKLLENKVDERFSQTLENLYSMLRKNGYDDSLNQSVIETVHKLSDKLNMLKLNMYIPPVKEIKEIKQKEIHLGPADLDKITFKDVNFTKGIMVQVSSGKYELFLPVRHDDHWDILPYEYIQNKIGIMPNLLLNGSKIN